MSSVNAMQSVAKIQQTSVHVRIQPFKKQLFPQAGRWTDLVCAQGRSDH